MYFYKKFRQNGKQILTRDLSEILQQDYLQIYITLNNKKAKFLKIIWKIFKRKSVNYVKKWDIYETTFQKTEHLRLKFRKF